MSLRRLLGRALPAAAALLAGATLAAPSAQAAPLPAQAVSPLGATVVAGGIPTAGALFPRGIAGNHTCSGTVVSAGGEPVVLTAAHCITGTAVGWSFVPQYRAGATPYGVWTVEAAYVDPRWSGGRNSAYDVAALRLRRKWIAGASRHVGYLTGSTILTGPPAGNAIVDITGYRYGRLDRPLACSSRYWWNRVAGYASCSYLPTGVSGAGMRFGNDGRGHQYLGGLIGGYHQGGCAIDDAYTPTFGPWVRDLVLRANRHAAPSWVAAPVWDGCVPARA